MIERRNNVPKAPSAGSDYPVSFDIRSIFIAGFVVDDSQQRIQIFEPIDDWCPGQGPSALTFQLVACFGDQCCTVLDVVRFVEHDTQEFVCGVSIGPVGPRPRSTLPSHSFGARRPGLILHLSHPVCPVDSPTVHLLRLDRRRTRFDRGRSVMRSVEENARS